MDESGTTEAGENTVARAKDYQRQQLQFSLIEEIGTLMFLIACVWIAPRVVGYLGEMPRYVLLLVFGAIVYVCYQVLFFGLDYAGGHRLEQKFALSTEAFGAWLWRHGKMVVVGGLLVGVLVAALYSALWYLKWWYVWCWVGWIAFSIVLTQVFPLVILPLFYSSTKLEDAELTQRLERLSEGTGVNVEGVYSLELSKSTRKGNAMLAGLGKTRRVLLGDTLLEKLTPEQIGVVYAHELGHHVHRHFAKNLILHGVGSIVLFGLLYLVLNDASGTGADKVALGVTRLPVVSLVLALFSFVLRPVSNGISRHFERQSDLYALRRTNDRDAFVAAFNALAEQNLADPNPASWIVIMYYNHPPIGQRIAMAEAFVGLGNSPPV